MMKIALNTLIICIVSFTSCNNSEPIEESIYLSGQLFYELEKEGIEKPGELDYNYISSSQGIAHTISGFSILYEGYFQLPDFSLGLSKTFKDNTPKELIINSYKLLGASAGSSGPPLVGVKNPTNILITEDNIENVQLSFNSLFGLKIIENTSNDWNRLPLKLKIKILNLVYSIHITNGILQQFTSPIISNFGFSPSTKVADYYPKLIQCWTEKQLTNFISIDAIDKVDLKKLSYASRLLTEEIQKILSLKVQQMNPEFTKCIFDSDFGKVGIFSNKKDTISGDYCLVIDFGGDDIYYDNIASSISLSKSIGIVIDLGGNDKYYGDEFIAAGILGIGMLFDMKGDDNYNSNKAGLASSLYGTSILYDAEGNDSYSSQNIFSQGSAHIGVAILNDKAGDDIYLSKSYSQAFGGTLGIGILLDNNGNDIYNASESQDKYKLPSFVQGTAKGRWAESTDGQSLGGGFGIFIDYSGNDKYYARSFSQGSAYYFGLGTLVDYSGNDEFNSLSHSQGYAAHYALSSFLEIGGDDIYNAKSDITKITQLIGSGRDMSVGNFVELSGNDTYNFGNRSCGIGDISGVGLLWDKAGNDAYIWHKNKIYNTSPSLGKSVGLNENFMINHQFLNLSEKINKGIFIDNYGVNKFAIH